MLAMIATRPFGLRLIPRTVLPDSCSSSAISVTPERLSVVLHVSVCMSRQRCTLSEKLAVIELVRHVVDRYHCAGTSSEQALVAPHGKRLITTATDS